MSSQYTFVAVIPARYASTRFPGKPLVEIDGRPMIQRVYERVATVLGEVYVATDDQRIASCVSGFGGRAIMTDGAHATGTDRIAEAMGKVESIRTLPPASVVVLNIQGDEPFIRPEQIRQLMACFQKTAEIATLVKKISDSHELFDRNRPKVVLTTDGRVLYFSRLPIPCQRNVPEQQWHTRHVYYKHLGVYGYRLDVLRRITMLPQSALEKTESLEQNRWLENGYSITAAVTDFESPAVDTPEDLLRLRETIAPS